MPDGVEVPKPDIDPALQWVWRAWHRLTRDRPFLAGGFGPAMPLPIPWREVVAWCDFHDYPGSAVAILDYFLRELDDEFFQWRLRQRPAGGST